MSISDWHEHDRPREKLLNFGADKLSDAELLAIFLRVGVKGKNAIELAQDLLDHFGDLHSLLNANETEFCSAKGLGQAKFVQLQAVQEISKRHFESGLKTQDAFTSPELVARFLNHELGHQTREKFGLLLLNQQNQLIEFIVLFEGSLTQSQVHIREVIKTALDYNAAAVILAHNHPSGDPTPSQADKDITLKITQALNLVDIRTLDHIIIGNAGRWCALSQHT